MATIPAGTTSSAAAADVAEVERDVKKTYGEKTAAFYESTMEGEMARDVVVRPLTAFATLTAGMDGPILDACGGCGHHVEWLAANTGAADIAASRTFIVRDLSEEMLGFARKRLAPLVEAGRCRIEAGNMAALEGIPDASCAGCLNCYAIHHVSPALVQQTLAEAARVLKPGGILMLQWWEGPAGRMEGAGEEQGLYGRLDLYPKDVVVAMATTAAAVNASAADDGDVAGAGGQEGLFELAQEATSTLDDEMGMNIGVAILRRR